MTKTQVLAAAAAALTAVVGVVGGVAVVKSNAHTQECNKMADRAISEYFEAETIEAQTKALQARFAVIRDIGGLAAAVELPKFVEDSKLNTAKWDAFEARSNRNRAEFEKVCGVDRVNQMRADLQKMVK